MDLLTGKIRPIYFKYLSAAFGSAMITSVYSIVDMAMVGQYQGPDGTAALAVVAPIWNIIYSLGLLMGIGGSVIFSTLRGQTERKGKVENEYFTTAVIGAAVLSVIAWLAILFFEKPILLFFGADINLLSLAQTYLEPIKVVVPFSCSTRCWRRSCATTARRGLPRRRCWRAASSMCSAITFCVHL